MTSGSQWIHDGLSLGRLIGPDVVPALSTIMICVEEAIGGPVMVVDASDHDRDLSLVDASVGLFARHFEETDISAGSKWLLVAAETGVK